MVELRLETLDIDDVPKDTFVSVRVGEVQKLCKITPARNYKFDEVVVGDRKFGKVEVFRRVGSTSVSIKNANPSEKTQEVSVQLNDGPAMSFNVRVSGKPEAQEKRKKESDKLETTEDNSKVLHAKQYLLEHNLEERLAEAVQAVLREKPEDPSAFIGEVLRKSSSDYKKLVQAQSSAPQATLGVPRAAFNQLPSVGPMMRSPRTMAAMTAPGAAVVSTSVAAGQAWCQKPSVGTWLSPVRNRPKEVSSTKPATGKPVSVEALRLEAKGTILKASLDGKLESTLQEVLTLATASKLSGSEFGAQRPLVMVPTSLLYGTTFASAGLRPNFMCF